jgi:hypothetical protein
MMPLDYMLKVIRDETATKERRDAMAISAAPYCHARLSYLRTGKNDQRMQAAETAGEGTAWANDLDEIRAN